MAIIIIGINNRYIGQINIILANVFVINVCKNLIKVGIFEYLYISTSLKIKKEEKYEKIDYYINSLVK